MPKHNDHTVTGGKYGVRSEAQKTLTRKGPAFSRQERTLTRPAPESSRETASFSEHGHGKSGLTITRTLGVGTGELVEKNDWEVGDIIDGRYEVISIIGQGGMGIVYKIHHREWNLELAVKVPLAHLVADERSKASFIREAQIWVDLGLHPNIVQCWYVREFGGIPRMFMDYMSGGSLRDWIAEGHVVPGQWDTVLDLIIQACDGLGYAYQQGVRVHRDVKPGNLLLSETGDVRVTDFGLVLGTPTGLPSKSTDRRDGATAPELEQGTPEYGAPEQWTWSTDIDQRADIYALGVILFEMCCGSRPFDDGSHQEPPQVLIGRHISSPAPDPRELQPDIPDPLADLILTCLEKTPDHRPDSMSAFREALAEVYHTILGKSYRRSVPRPAELRSDALNNRAVSLLDLGKREEAISLWAKALKLDVYHPESVYNKALLEWVDCMITDDEAIRRLEEIKHASARANLYLAMIHLERAAADKAEEALEEAIQEPELSVNSLIWRTLGDSRVAQQKYSKAEEAYQRALELMSEELKERETRRLALIRETEQRTQAMLCWQRGFRSFGGGHKDAVTAVVITPDGRFVLSGSQDTTIRLWNLTTREFLWVFEGHTEQILSLAVSHDGRYVASGSQDKTIRLWNLETGRAQWITRGHSRGVTALAFTPDGRHLVSGGWDGTLRLWNLETGRNVWKSEKHDTPVNALAVTPDTWGVLSAHDEDDLYLWELTTGLRAERKFYGAPLDRLGFVASGVSTLTISSDGQYAATGKSDGTVNVWSLETGEILRVCKGHDANVTAVAVTPDSRLIVSGSEDTTLRVWDLETGQGLLSFSGHEQAIRSLSITPDGRFIITGSQDTTMRLWDLETERCLWIFWGDVGHQTGVTAVTVSPDGDHILSGGRDSTLRLWELTNSQCIRIFDRYRTEMTAVAVTPDGRFVVSGSDDGTVWLWDIETSDYVRIFEGHDKAVTSVTVTPDGWFIVSGSIDRTVRLWELSTGKCTRIFHGHKAGVTAVAVMPDGQILLSGSFDKTIRLWDIATAKCKKIFKGHHKAVSALSLSPDGKQAVSGSRDGTLCLWDLTTRQCFRMIYAHSESVSGVALTPDGLCALSSSTDRTLRIWEVLTGRCLRTFRGHLHRVNAAAITPKGYFAVTGSEDTTLRLWDIDPGSPRYEAVIQVCRQRSLEEIRLAQERYRKRMEWAQAAWDQNKAVAACKYLTQARSIGGYERAPESLNMNAMLNDALARKTLRGAWLTWTLEGREQPVTAVAATPDGKFILSGSADAALSLWDMATGECLRVFTGHQAAVTAVAVTPDSRFVLSGSEDTTLRLWHLDSGACLRVYEGHSLGVTTVTMTPYGQFLLSGSRDRTLRMWNPSTTKCLHIFKGHDKAVEALSVSPDRKRILSGCEARKIRIWNRESGECVRVLRGHQRGVTALCVSPNGQFFLSGSRDQTVKIWKMHGGESFWTFEGHEGSVTSLVMTPDARFAISGSADATMRMWNVVTGKPVWIFEGHTSGINALSMTPNGRYLISGNQDATVKVFELDWEFDTRKRR